MHQSHSVEHLPIPPGNLFADLLPRLQSREDHDCHHDGKHQTYSDHERASRAQEQRLGVTNCVHGSYRLETNFCASPEPGRDAFHRPKLVSGNMGTRWRDCLKTSTAWTFVGDFVEFDGNSKGFR